MDHNLISLYFFYRTPLLRALRLLVAATLLLFIVGDISQGIRPTFPLFLFNLYIMMEIFYRYRLSTLQGEEVITQSSSQDPLHVTTLPALSSLHGSRTAVSTVKRLLTFPQVRFFLERANISLRELPETDMGNAILLRVALKIAKELGGKRITTMDLLAAYLLLEEEKSKLLFTKKLKDSDLMQILRWTRLLYPYEEEVRRFEILVGGGGIGEFLVSGWTFETQKYTRNFTNAIQEREVSIIGREQEYQHLKESLLKPENNNVSLIGDHGVGKEQIVRRLALDSYYGKIEKKLRYKTILELLVGSLLAGATSQGELQARVQAVIEEISHAENIILYIPEFQDLIGGKSFSMDLSGALVPYLKTGKLPIIASLTSGNFKAYLERSPLLAFFTPVKLQEPTQKQSELMVMEKAPSLERLRHAIITYRALKTAVEYANQYSDGAVLPESALMLLSDALSSLDGQAPLYDKTQKVLLTEEQILKTIEVKTKIALREPSQDERTLLLHLEEVLHKSIIGQREAITTIAEAMRRLRSGMDKRSRPVSFLFLGPTGVGKTETAKALSRVYFGGEQAMIRLDMSEYADEGGQRRLLGSLPGEGEALGELTEKVRDHPFALLLLDEFEKAHSSIINLFLQILEDGRLTDNRGRTVSFMNTIIIATSNAGSDFIHTAVEQGRAIDDQFERSLLEYLQEKNIFRPELLNRFDAIVTFKPLTLNEISQVTRLLLQDVIKRLREKDITASFDAAVIEKIVREGYNKEFGARPIRRYLQDNIEDMIAEALLKDEIHRGDKVQITVTPEGAFGIASEHGILDKKS